jgi:hypothetical protein
MKTLTEQLSDLSDRANKTKDVVAAAREKNRAKLESERVKLTTSIAEGNARAGQHIATAKGNVEARWNDTRSSVDQWFSTIRTDAEERRTERGIKKADHHADLAEQDAAYAIDLALYVLDQAEYAVVEAVIARADADDMAMTG